MTTKQLTTIEKELPLIAEQALVFTIAHDVDMKKAVTLLSQLNKYNDRITEEKEKVTKPLNEALKAERARWKPMELQNQTAIDAIRLEMTRYQTELTNQRKADEQRIANAVASGKIKKIETAVKHIDALDIIEKNHSTEAGDVQFREKKQLLITNVDEIPREYMLPDEIALLRDLKAGKQIDGVTLETVQVVVNFR